MVKLSVVKGDDVDRHGSRGRQSCDATGESLKLKAGRGGLERRASVISRQNHTRLDRDSHARHHQNIMWSERHLLLAVLRAPDDTIISWVGRLISETSLLETSAATLPFQSQQHHNRHPSHEST